MNRPNYPFDAAVVGVENGLRKLKRLLKNSLGKLKHAPLDLQELVSLAALNRVFSTSNACASPTRSSMGFSLCAVHA
jgi:hypothetical protein